MNRSYKLERLINLGELLKWVESELKLNLIKTSILLGNFTLPKGAGVILGTGKPGNLNSDINVVNNMG